MRAGATVPANIASQRLANGARKLAAATLMQYSKTWCTNQYLSVLHTCRGWPADGSLLASSTEAEPGFGTVWIGPCTNVPWPRQREVRRSLENVYVAQLSLVRPNCESAAHKSNVVATVRLCPAIGYMRDMAACQAHASSQEASVACVRLR